MLARGESRRAPGNSFDSRPNRADFGERPIQGFFKYRRNRRLQPNDRFLPLLAGSYADLKGQQRVRVGALRPIGGRRLADGTRSARTKALRPVSPCQPLDEDTQTGPASARLARKECAAMAHRLDIASGRNEFERRLGNFRVQIQRDDEGEPVAMITANILAPRHLSEHQRSNGEAFEE